MEHQGKQAPPLHTYLETVVWSFDSNIRKPDLVQSEIFKLRNFDDISFCLQAATSSNTTITIELLRLTKPSNPLNDGYVLEAYITLIPSRSATECRIINSNCVSVNYNIADLKKINKIGSWVVRCAFKMNETTYLNNSLRNQQEKLLQVMETNPRYGHVSKGKIQAMASLLKRKSISKIFTGRQNHSFAISKCIFIERTLRYAEEIFKKIEAKKNNASYVQKHQPLNYLFYIYCEKDGKISVKEAADLFVSAHYYGLDYLKADCAEFLLNNLEISSELFPDALLAADFVIDQDLLDKVLDIYIKNKKQIMTTIEFTRMLNCDEVYSYGMVHALTTKIVEEKQLLLSGSSAGAQSKPPDVSPDKSCGRKPGKKRFGKR